MAERFYLNFPPIPGEVLLQGPEARHLATVCRAKPGERIILFCGDGHDYPAEVVAVGKRDVTLSVETPVAVNREPGTKVEIAAAIPKGDRGDFLIEKLTELGVARFIPLRTARSVVHPRLDRLQRTVIEACKQCGRNKLMEIAEITPWEVHCRSVTGIRLLAHVGEHQGMSQANEPNTSGVRIRPRHEATSIAVGPEGGFTADEVGLAQECGWSIVGLGPSILRVETAAIALAAYSIFSD